MFDAKRLLEAMVSATAPQPSAAPSPAPGSDAPAVKREGTEERKEQNAAEQPEESVNVSELMAKLQQQLGPAAGGLMGTLGKIFGQAAQGVREGAGRASEAVGLEELVAKMSGGKSSQEMLEQVKSVIARNQLVAGAALGGLGALLLGTRTGRSLAEGAAKAGALALIGGLAYKAYQNYQQGKPLLGDTGEVPAAAPQGSGFEPGAISNETAALYVKAMIAAAAADGRVDAGESARILSGLKQAGVPGDAEAFLSGEIAHPASVEEIAAAVHSKEEGAQVYTAARLAIDPDSEAERTFLSRLADKLGLDAGLTAHIDASARKMAA